MGGVRSLTLQDLMHSDVADKLLHGVVLQVTVAAVHLERLVTDLKKQR